MGSKLPPSISFRAQEAGLDTVMSGSPDRRSSRYDPIGQSPRSERMTGRKEEEEEDLQGFIKARLEGRDFRRIA